MAGIDQITSEILQEAQQSAQSILDEAGSEADRVIAEARKEAEKITAKADEAAAAERARGEARAASRKEVLLRQATLEARQKIIREVIDQAQETLANQDSDAYFKMLVQLVASHADAGEGILLLPEAKLTELTEAQKSELQKAAAVKGGTITIEPERTISDGCILRYGGIDENCTLDALFAQAKDEMQDTVQKILWQE